MKTKHLILAGLVVLSQILQSCLKGEDVYKEKEPTYTELDLNIGGECSLTEKPMSRADASKEIFGINVAMLIQNPNGSVTQKPYAYGIFDNIKAGNLKLNVLDGYQYRISCTMIKEGKDSLLTKDGTLYPLTLSKGNDPKLGTITNKFITAERPDGTQEYLFDLENSKIGTKGQSNYTRPFIQRYHGIIDKLTVAPDQTNTLEVYRRYFGVQFKQNGLQADCKLEIQIDGAPTVWLTPNKKESPRKTSRIRNPISDILLAQLHNRFAKNSSIYYADFTKCKKRIKNLQKSVDKSPRRKYNNTCKQRSCTNTKSSCGSFCFKRDCKSSAVSAKAQRGADRIFSDPFQEKAAQPQSENYLLKGAVINGFLIHANSCCRVGRQNSGNC